MVVMNKIPFLYSPPSTRPALSETIPYTIKLTFCPSLKIISFTLILVVALITLYITSCAMGIDTKQSVLQIDVNVLKKLGANVPKLVRQGEVYRLITAAFLHSNLPHLLSNLFYIFFILTRLEAAYHPMYLIALFLISAVGGNILSDVATTNNNQLSVGTSTAIFGYIATLVAYLIMNWGALKKLGPMRRELVCAIGVITFISILLTVMSFSNRVDVFGHLGGFATGLCGALLILPRIDGSRGLITRILGGIGLLAFFLPTFLVMFLSN